MQAEPWIGKLGSEDDTEAFVCTSKRMGSAAAWKELTWAMRMEPFLLAEAPHRALSKKQLGMYPELKADNLETPGLTPEAYNYWFRSSHFHWERVHL